MSEKPPTISAADVVAEARSWIGTPFRHQGRTKGARVDCGGVVLGVLWALEYTDLRFDRYGRRPDGRVMREMCDTLLDRVEDLRPGDLVLLHWEGNPQHLGWLGDRGTGPSGLSMIHADPKAGTTHEVSFDGFWRSQLVQAYRLRGISP